MPDAFPCPRCGNYLPYGTLACPFCGALVYVDRLNQLSQEAMRLEPSDPSAAAVLWRQCLDLLPPNSQQYQMVLQRLGMLEGQRPASALKVERVPRGPDTWRSAVVKTGGSMLLSIILYAMLFGQEHGMFFGASFATGFVLLILVHELGHVAAMRHYGLSASPPIFIPFMGALINLRQPPRNAWEEAIVGIGGPLAGTVGAIATLGIYLLTGQPLMLELAYWGLFLNFFNLLPVPPLDGGRITAAVSPWIWMPGLLAVVLLIVRDWIDEERVNPILVLLLLFAWPRVKQTLAGEARKGPYYQIGRRRAWIMGAVYFGLGALLFALMVIVTHLAGGIGIFA